MEYCRSLKFEQDPDYKYMIGLFEKCLHRHNLDQRVHDYMWKQNRLSKDKEALKNSVLNVINKKKNPDEAKKPNPGAKVEPEGMPKQPMQVGQKNDGSGAHYGVGKKEENKAMPSGMNSNMGVASKN